MIEHNLFFKNCQLQSTSSQQLFNDSCLRFFLLSKNTVTAIKHATNRINADLILELPLTNDIFTSIAIS